MARHLPKSSETQRSQKLLGELIRKNPSFLSTQAGNPISWKSPVGSDEFAEYSDADVLKVLELSLPARRLAEFWPNRGPVWDGLGIEEGGNDTRILLEAKAYIEETDTTPTQAGEASKKRIEESLNETRFFMKATGGHADWSRSCYQYTDRLAHLYLLAQVNSLPTELWYVYFCNLPKDPKTTTLEKWKGAIRLLHSHLGIGPRNPLRRQIREFFVDAQSLEQLDAAP